MASLRLYESLLLAILKSFFLFSSLPSSKVVPNTDDDLVPVSGNFFQSSVINHEKRKRSSYNCGSVGQTSTTTITAGCSYPYCRHSGDLIPLLLLQAILSPSVLLNFIILSLSNWYWFRADNRDVNPNVAMICERRGRDGTVEIAVTLQCSVNR